MPSPGVVSESEFEPAPLFNSDQLNVPQMRSAASSLVAAARAEADEHIESARAAAAQDRRIR